MSQGTAPDSAKWSLRSRGPAHAVSRDCLDAQQAARPRGIFTRLAGADPLHPDAVALYARALAELRVAHLLTALGPEYRVLHAVPDADVRAGVDGDGHIDHLLIGPPGVLAITTTSQDRRRVDVRGTTFLVDGQRTPHLAAAEREARAAALALRRATGAPVAVTPVVVVVGARGIRFSEDPGSAVVLAARELVSSVRVMPVVLGPDLVASIARAAEEWTTWRPLTAELGASPDPAPAFARLHQKVVRARRIRILWFLGAVGALVVVAFGAASGIVV